MIWWQKWQTSYDGKDKKHYRRTVKCIRIWLKGRWQGVVLEGKVPVGTILTVSSSRSVHKLRMEIMGQNFFDVVFWYTGTKQSIPMEFVRTRVRIQRWIMKPCRKLDWMNGPSSMVQYARTSTCGLVTRGVAVQVAMTV